MARGSRSRTNGRENGQARGETARENGQARGETAVEKRRRLRLERERELMDRGPEITDRGTGDGQPPRKIRHPVTGAMIDVGGEAFNALLAESQSQQSGDGQQHMLASGGYPGYVPPRRQDTGQYPGVVPPRTDAAQVDRGRDLYLTEKQDVSTVGARGAAEELALAREETRRREEEERRQREEEERKQREEDEQRRRDDLKRKDDERRRQQQEDRDEQMAARRRSEQRRQEIEDEKKAAAEVLQKAEGRRQAGKDVSGEYEAIQEQQAADREAREQREQDDEAEAEAEAQRIRDRKEIQRVKDVEAERELRADRDRIAEERRVAQAAAAERTRLKQEEDRLAFEQEQEQLAAADAYEKQQTQVGDDRDGAVVAPSVQPGAFVPSPSERREQLRQAEIDTGAIPPPVDRTGVQPDMGQTARAEPMTMQPRAEAVKPPVTMQPQAEAMQPRAETVKPPVTMQPQAEAMQPRAETVKPPVTMQPRAPVTAPTPAPDQGYAGTGGDLGATGLAPTTTPTPDQGYMGTGRDLTTTGLAPTTTPTPPGVSGFLGQADVATAAPAKDQGYMGTGKALGTTGLATAEAPAPDQGYMGTGKALGATGLATTTPAPAPDQGYMGTGKALGTTGLATTTPAPAPDQGYMGTGKALGATGLNGAATAPTGVSGFLGQADVAAPEKPKGTSYYAGTEGVLGATGVKPPAEVGDGEDYDTAVAGVSGMEGQVREGETEAERVQRLDAAHIRRRELQRVNEERRLSFDRGGVSGMEGQIREGETEQERVQRVQAAETADTPGVSGFLGQPDSAVTADDTKGVSGMEGQIREGETEEQRVQRLAEAGKLARDKAKETALGAGADTGDIEEQQDTTLGETGRASESQKEIAEGLKSTSAETRTVFQELFGKVGELFGGDPGETLGRDARSGVEKQIVDQTEQLAINAERQRELAKERVTNQFAEQRAQLARMFAIQPGGERSGDAQRAFEQLGAAEANAMIAEEQRVDQMVRDEARSNITTLQGVQESREAAALQQGNFALMRDDMDLKTRTQVSSEGFQDRALSLEQEGKGLEAERVRQAGEQLQKSFEQFDAQLDQSAERLGLDRDQIEGQLAQNQQQVDAQVQKMERDGTLDFERLGFDRDVFEGTIQQQGLERDRLTMQFADELNLSHDQFNQMVTESDRQWDLTKDETARMGGLDAAKFGMALDELEFAQSIAGRQQDAAERSQDFGEGEAGLQRGLEYQRLEEQRAGRVQQAGQFAAGQDFDALRLAQEQRQFGAELDLNSEQAQAQMQDIADRYGLDRDQFEESTRRFTETYDDQQAELARVNGVSEEKWNMSKQEIERANREHELFWNGMMNNEADQVNLNLESFAEDVTSGNNLRDMRSQVQDFSPVLGSVDWGEGRNEQKLRDLQTGKDVWIDRGNLSNDVFNRLPLEEQNEIRNASAPDREPWRRSDQGDDYDRGNGGILMRAADFDFSEQVTAGTVMSRGAGTTENDVINYVKRETGRAITTEQAALILDGDNVTLQPSPTDWINSYTPEQRGQLLALMSGGAITQGGGGGGQQGGGVLGMAGQLVGQLGAAWLGNR